jgi:hypothetical protein
MRIHAPLIKGVLWNSNPLSSYQYFIDKHVEAKPEAQSFHSDVAMAANRSDPIRSDVASRDRIAVKVVDENKGGSGFGGRGGGT